MCECVCVRVRARTHVRMMYVDGRIGGGTGTFWSVQQRTEQQR